MSAEAVHYNMHDAKTHLSRIIERVERGEEIIIDRAGYGGAFALTAAVSSFGAIWWLFCVPRIQQVELD